MKLLQSQLRVLPDVSLRGSAQVALCAAGAVVGVGLLPQVSVAGISVAALFFLLAIGVHAILTRPDDWSTIPRSWLLVPILIVSIARVQSYASLEMAARVLVGCLVGLAIVDVAKDQRILSRFLKSIAIGSVFFLLVLDYHSIVVFKVPFLTADIAIPTRAGRNSVGFLLSVAMPASFAFRGKAVRLLLLAFFLANAVYLQSRGALLAFFAAVGIAFGFRLLKVVQHPLALLERPASLRALASPIAVAMVVGVLWRPIADLLTAFVFVEHTSDDLRLRLSGLAVEAFRQHPLVGIGAGRFQFRSPEGLLTHNDYLSVLAECGLLGALPFLGIVGSAFARAVKLLAIESRGLSQGTGELLLAQGLVGVALSTYLFVINGYTALVFWIALGIVHTVPGTVEGGPRRVTAKDTQRRY